MSGCRESRGSVVGRDGDGKFGLVLVATIQRRIYRNLLLSGNADPRLRTALLPSVVRTPTVDNRFTKGKLEPPKDHSVECVRLGGRHHGDSISRSVTSVRTLNCKGHAILGEPPGLRLSIDRPCCVEFVLVDDDRCGYREDIILISSKETPVPQWLRILHE